MMKKLLSLLLAVLMLAACGNNVPPEESTEPMDVTEPTETTETTVPTEPTEPTVTTEPTEPTEPTTPEEPPKPTGGVLTYPGLDYSHHSDENESWYESDYDSALVDLTKLQEGNPLYAVIEPPATWELEFTGFEQTSDGSYDFRSTDLSQVDLSGIDWKLLEFNTDTGWPTELPEGFDPKEVLEYGKNPGLGIRELHERGITGQGVSIAIVDQGLLLSHEEYADNLMLYERIHCGEDNAQMHGPGVSGIAVGKTIGTAPDSKLYYIASTFGHYSEDYVYDAAIMADCVMRVLEINDNLPDDEKIRVISISRGYGKDSLGYEALQDAIKQADEQGVFVITTTPHEYYENFYLTGMERDYSADPDDFESWTPLRWQSNFYTANKNYSKYLWLPAGGRTYAGCQRDDAYEITPSAGFSWATPWVAGFYAMCCQVDPDITPTRFIQLALDTAVTVEVEHEGKSYPMQMVINPAAVIEALENP